MNNGLVPPVDVPSCWSSSATSVGADLPCLQRRDVAPLAVADHHLHFPPHCSSHYNQQAVVSYKPHQMYSPTPVHEWTQRNVLVATL